MVKGVVFLALRMERMIDGKRSRVLALRLE